jgi:hypothetical protein
MSDNTEQYEWIVKIKENLEILFADNPGVEEYYLYDPRRANFQGWSRQEDLLQPIENINGWVSPRLKIRFQWQEDTLSIYYPNGDRFLSSIELAQKAEQEKQRAEFEKQRADQEKQRAERLAQRLKELGINPDELS